MKRDLRQTVMIHAIIAEGIAYTNPQKFVIHLIPKEDRLQRNSFDYNPRRTNCRKKINCKIVYSLDGFLEYARICSRCLNIRLGKLKPWYEKTKNTDPSSFQFDLLNGIPPNDSRSNREANASEQSRQGPANGQNP